MEHHQRSHAVFSAFRGYAKRVAAVAHERLRHWLSKMAGTIRFGVMWLMALALFFTLATISSGQRVPVETGWEAAPVWALPLGVEDLFGGGY